LNFLTDIVPLRLSGYAIPSTCVVEPSYIRTFDNKTVEYAINDCEHVLLLDGSRRLPVAVVTKTIPEQKKMVRILAGVTEVHLIPVSGAIEVEYNRVKIPINLGEIVMKKSPTGIVMTLIKRYHDNTYLVYIPSLSLTVITDGVRVEVVAPRILKSRAAGLCGDMNDEITADLKTPRMCVMRSKLAAISYMLNKAGTSSVFPRCSGIPAQFHEEFARESQICTKETIIPTPVLKLYERITSLQVGASVCPPCEDLRYICALPFAPPECRTCPVC